MKPRAKGCLLPNSFQDNRKFYMVNFKEAAQQLSTPAISDQGLHLKLVESSTGPDLDLQYGIYNSATSPGQVGAPLHCFAHHYELNALQTFLLNRKGRLRLWLNRTYS